MKIAAVVWQISSLFLLLLFTGCEPRPKTTEGLPLDDRSDLSIYAEYAPVKIEIIPLTELTSGEDGETSTINAYVSLLDPFGCQVKSPGVFRFELYKRLLRSAEPKGKRIFIWPDIHLIDPSQNQRHWQDFLRAYQFNLDFDSGGDQDYILQVTCLCPNGKRLSAQCSLKHPQ